MLYIIYFIYLIYLVQLSVSIVEASKFGVISTRRSPEEESKLMISPQIELRVADVQSK